MGFKINKKMYHKVEVDLVFILEGIWEWSFYKWVDDYVNKNQYDHEYDFDSDGLWGGTGLHFFVYR